MRKNKRGQFCKRAVKAESKTEKVKEAGEAESGAATVAEAKSDSVKKSRKGRKVNKGKALAKATETIFEKLPVIVNAVSQKAAEGSYLHAKFLYDLARVDEVPLPDAEPKAESTAAGQLMRSLEELTKKQATANGLE